MRSLAAAAVLFSCIAIALASWPETTCCMNVVTSKITVPITGYKLQHERPPCVKAVIFFTDEGPICSNWRESWVKEKVTELSRLQAVGKSKTTDP